MRLLLHRRGQRADARGPAGQAAPGGGDRERGLGLSFTDGSSGDGLDEASLVYVVGRVNQGILREMRARLSGLQLSVQEYTALSVLRSRPGLSNAQLARRSLVTPQSMIETLAKLEHRGLITREVDGAHSRILRAELTRDGRRLLRAADPSIRAIQEQMLADVPEGQRRMVLEGMLSAMRKLSGGLGEAE